MSYIFKKIDEPITYYDPAASHPQHILLIKLRIGCIMTDMCALQQTKEIMTRMQEYKSNVGKINKIQLMTFKIIWFLFFKQRIDTNSNYNTIMCKICLNAKHLL